MIVIELFAGSFGWSAGALELGAHAIGFDIEHLPHHGPIPAGAELVLQDVLTIHGSQFKNADLLLCSPPCQKYSWLAMPWSRSKDPENSKAAKALRRKWETEGPDNRLFDACFRIQREAIAATRIKCEACHGTGQKVTDRSIRLCLSYGDPMEIGTCPYCAGNGYIGERYIPMVVENVRGAQEWVGKRHVTDAEWFRISRAERIALGRSNARMGSFHLWGDVAMVGRRIVMFQGNIGHIPRFGNYGLAVSTRAATKVGGIDFSGYGTPGYKAVAFNGTAEKRYLESQRTQDGSSFRERNGEPQPGIRHKDRGRNDYGRNDEGDDQSGNPVGALCVGDDNTRTAQDGGILGALVTSGIKGIATDRTTLQDGTGGTSWFGAGKRADPRDVKRGEDGEYGMPDGTKIGGDWFRDPACHSAHGSRSSARKAASAQIARIPLELSRFIAQQFLLPK